MTERVAFHPFLFAVFPILFVYERNGGDLPFSAALLPLGATLLCVGLLVLLGTRLSIDRRLWALGISASVLLFFSYGHVHAVLLELPPLEAVGYHKTTLVLCTLFLGATWGALRRARAYADYLTRMANGMSVILLLIPLGNVVAASAQASARFPTGDGVAVETLSAAIQRTERRPPDIYYMVLDGYGRADVLRDQYQLDTSEFLRFLRSHGFFVAERSRANYFHTVLAIAAALNLDHLTGLADGLGRESTNRRPLKRLIARSALVRFLRSRGYRFVAYATGHGVTSVVSADRYLSPVHSLTEFSAAFYESTPLQLLEVLARRVDVYQLHRYSLHRRRILYALDGLSQDSLDRRPRFVFAHLLAPHPPFVFGPRGEAVQPERRYSLDDENYASLPGASQEEYRTGYRNQVQFLNGRLPQVIDDIIRHSGGNVIIVLQGDHGPKGGYYVDGGWRPNLGETYGILNAYYFPDGDYRALYPGVTPVNSFRIILNSYFGAAYQLVPDRSYWSGGERIYDLRDVTPILDGVAADDIQPMSQ